MITLGIGEIGATRPPEHLATFALGSCVGVCLYDRSTKIAGLAHVMLPKSNPGNFSNKYADVAIINLVREMEKLGASRLRMEAKIAGGAKMFESVANSSIGNIGDRNVEAVEAILADLRIRIIARDTGLNYGRTVYFYPQDGRLEIKTAKGTSCTI